MCWYHGEQVSPSKLRNMTSRSLDATHNIQILKIYIFFQHYKHCKRTLLNKYVLIG